MKKKIITLALAVIMCLFAVTSISAISNLNRVESTFLAQDAENNDIIEKEYNYIEDITVQIPETDVIFRLEKVAENVYVSYDGTENIPTYYFNFYEFDSKVVFFQEIILSIGSYSWWYENGVAFGMGDVAPSEWDIHMGPGSILQSDYDTSHETYSAKILKDGTIVSYSSDEKAIAKIEFCFNTMEAYPYNNTIDISLLDVNYEESIKKGWVEDDNGWRYYNNDGTLATNKWLKDSVGWCYVGADGYCVTNTWKKDSKGWCYLDANGRMATNKWIKDSQG